MVKGLSRSRRIFIQTQVPFFDGFVGARGQQKIFRQEARGANLAVVALKMFGQCAVFGAEQITISPLIANEYGFIVRRGERDGHSLGDL